MNTQELIARWSSWSAEDLAAKASEHLPIWASLFLVIVIAYYLARLVWLVYPASDAVLWAPPQTPATGFGTAGAGSSFKDYGAITNAHLFGTASETVEPVAHDAEDAPDTRLNLSLRATVAATEKDVAHAIIADGAGTEKVYFIGDPVPGGATLYGVDVERVILNRGGVMEALRLPKKFTNTGVSSLRTQPARRSQQSSNIQELISQNAATFAEIIRPQPFMPNGQLKGYRVFPGRNRRQFLSLGLRPGDLVTEINGIPLNDPTQGMDVFNTLGTSSQISVTVERNGRPQVLNLDSSQIVSSGNGPR